jgi:cytochrome P450
MSLEEILCQISTFITAGHETVSSALTWCLYALARDQAVQDRLRAALRALPPPPPSSGGCPHELMDEIERCVYLDWVVRETLRVHSPVTATMREVGRAVDEIPLGRGVRERGEDAAPRGAPGSVRVHRGDIITIPIQAVNKSVDVWGPDAVLFRPERWGEVRAQGAGAETIPGMYAGVLTFLNGGGGAGGAGNRACIGWKFALDEIKILLYVLVRDVEFGIDPGMVIEKKIKCVIRCLYVLRWVLTFFG